MRATSEITPAVVIKRRIRRGGEVEEREYKVEGGGAEALIELHIPPIIEVRGLGAPDFTHVSVKRVVGRGFKLLTCELLPTVSARWRAYRFPRFSEPLDLQRTRVAPLQLRAGAKLTGVSVSPPASVRMVGGAAKSLAGIVPAYTFPWVTVRRKGGKEPDIEPTEVHTFEPTMILLGKDLKELGLGAYIGEPIFVILRKGSGFDHLVRVICRELYREARGGLPEPYEITSEERLRNFILAGERFQDRIVVFDGVLDGLVERERLENLCRCAFRELFSQSLGFIVVISEDPVKLSNRLKELCFPYMPVIVDMSSPGVKGGSLLFCNTVKVLWGIRSMGCHPVFSVNEVVSNAERRFNDTLREMMALEKYLNLAKRGVNESEEHFALKVLAFKHLVEVENLDLARIKTEEKVSGQVVADLYVEGRGLAVEVETLYGAGPAPLLNVRDSVLKYRGSGIREVWVVLRNLPVALYLTDLLRLRKFLREEMRPMQVEFYVPSLEERRLVSLDEIIQRLKTLKKQYSQAEHVPELARGVSHQEVRCGKS